MFVPMDSINKFEQALYKLNGRLAKYGSHVEILSKKEGYLPVQYDKDTEYISGVFSTSSYGYKQVSIHGYEYTLSEPEVTGKEGVKFLGTLSFADGVAQLHSDDNDLVNKVNTDRKDVCFHCGKKMSRNKWFFFDDHGTIRKIGSTCVAEWFGLDVNVILRYYENFIKQADKLRKGPHRESAAVEFDDFVAQLSHVTKGFRLAWTKTEEMMPGTAQQVRNEILENVECDPVDVEEIKAKVKEEWDIEPTTNFKFNVLNALFDDNKEVVKHVPFTHFGLVGWAVYKAMQPKREATDSEYVGKVGERIHFSGTPKCIYGYETVYGYSFVYLFETEKGNIKWKTSKNLDDREYKLVGTVKGHEEYKGTKQTEVTRCQEI